MCSNCSKLLKYENFLTCLKYSGLLNDIVCSRLCFRYCGNPVSHFQKEEIFKVGSVFNLIDISSGSLAQRTMVNVTMG